MLISGNLLDSNLHFRQWVGCGGDSDHQPILLQILNDDIRSRSPFKFNANWLVNDGFVSLLKNSWNVFYESLGLSSAS